MFQGKLRAEKISFFKPIRLSYPCTVTNTFIPTDEHTVHVCFQLGGHNLSSIGLPPLLSWMTLSKLLKVSVSISSSLNIGNNHPTYTQDCSEEQRRAKMSDTQKALF